jgi:hypothetical protein
LDQIRDFGLLFMTLDDGLVYVAKKRRASGSGWINSSAVEPRLTTEGSMAESLIPVSCSDLPERWSEWLNGRFNGYASRVAISPIDGLIPILLLGFNFG